MKKEQVVNPVVPLHVRDCTILMLSTGIRAQNLREFREGIEKVHPDSIYHHFWGRLLQPHQHNPEYNSDFAAWFRHALNEKALAEKLSVIDPIDYKDIEELRSVIIELVEERLDESEFHPWARADQQFYFLRSQLIKLDSGITLNNPDELPAAIKEMSDGCIYYHFIENKRHSESSIDGFSEWLQGGGDRYKSQIKELNCIDPRYLSLRELHNKLIDIFNPETGGGKDV